jgi:hypothetical protein
MDVELSIVPDDELPALVEDSMLLPPLDLTLTGEAQESTSVMVLMPVPRYQFRRLSQSLPTLTRELPPAQPGMIAKRKPITALNQLLLRRAVTLIQPEVASADSLWRAEISKQNQFWYLRRRNLHYKAEVTSWAIEMWSDEVATDTLVTDRVVALNLETRYNAVLSRATSSGAAELTAFMASPLISQGSDAVAKAAVAELEKADTIDSLTVIKAAEKFSAPSFGEGLSRLENSEAIAGKSSVVDNVAKSGLLPQLDTLSRTLPEEEFKAMTIELADAGSGNDAAAVERVTKVIEEKAAAANITAQPSGPIVTKPLTPALRVTPGTTTGLTRG